MSLIFKVNQSEEFYRKLLLLNKVKPFLIDYQKQYIFNKGYCWEVLLKDKDAPESCYNYAMDVIKGPFPEGEPYIAKNSYFSYRYAEDVLRGSFPLGEKAIASNSYQAYLYAKEILKGPFPEGEKVIATDYEDAYLYAKHVLKDRFPLAEKIIINSRYKNYYLEFLKSIGKLNELDI